MIRMTGLNSGLDTDSIVQALMSAPVSYTHLDVYKRQDIE